MPRQITIRFYEELNDFLHKSLRKKAFTHSFTGTPTVKDIIESLGIPHTEIDLILANGNPVGFNYKPSGGDYVSVYPIFESLDISGTTRLRPKPLRFIRFILDVHLGKLARYLRMLGFDVSERTVGRYMPNRPADPGTRQSWNTFLRNHRDALAGME